VFCFREKSTVLAVLPRFLTAHSAAKQQFLPGCCLAWDREDNPIAVAAYCLFFPGRPLFFAQHLHQTQEVSFRDFGCTHEHCGHVLRVCSGLTDSWCMLNLITHPQMLEAHRSDPQQLASLFPNQNSTTPLPSISHSQSNHVPVWNQTGLSVSGSLALFADSVPNLGGLSKIEPKNHVEILDTFHTAGH
jgi:hypothetical protein